MWYFMSYIPGWSGTPYICLPYTRQHPKFCLFYCLQHTPKNQQDRSRAKKLLQKSVTYITQWQKQKLHGTTTFLSHCHTTLLHFAILTAVDTLNTNRIVTLQGTWCKKVLHTSPSDKAELHGKTAFLTHCVLIQPWPDMVAWTK